MQFQGAGGVWGALVSLQTPQARLAVAGDEAKVALKACVCSDTLFAPIPGCRLCPDGAGRLPWGGLALPGHRALLQR